MDASLLMCKAARRIVLMTTLPSSLHRPASLLRRTMNLQFQGNQGMFDGVWLFMIKVLNLSLLNLAIAAGRQEKRPKMKLTELNICKTKGQLKILLMEFQMRH